MIINSISYKPFEKEKFYQVISDYEKAIELTGNSKQIGHKLAGVYFSDEHTKKPSKLLKNILKKKNSAIHIITAKPYVITN